MIRFSRWTGLGSLLVLVVGLLAAGGQWLEAAQSQPAEPEMRAWGDPHILLAIDTGSPMAEQLAVLAGVWDDTDIVHVSQAVYRGWQFSDTVAAGPPTTNPALIQEWLNSLEAAPSDSCTDAMLQALMAASLWKPESFNDARALLVSDSSPMGGRPALARTINRLLEQGVQVYPLQSGWCAEKITLPIDVIKLLGQMTGGTAFPLHPGTEMTHTRMALNLMAAPSDLLSVKGAVTPGDPDIYEFEVDSSITGLMLQANDADPDWWPQCLTCTLRLQPTAVASHGKAVWLTATLRLPGGQILGQDSPGVTFLYSGYGIQLSVDSPSDQPLPSGTWQLRLEGSAAYELRLAADAAIQMAYAGPHSVPAGQPFPVHVSLLLPAVQSGPQPAAPAYELKNLPVASYFRPLEGGATLPGPLLYDDGEHNDGAAGDGLFGGAATLPPGAYLLSIQAELEDGTFVRRLDPAPIRARRFHVRPPASRDAAAGSTITHTFVITNEGATTDSYELLAESSQGWAQTGSVPVSVTLSAGQMITLSIPVHIPAGATPGLVEETTLTLTGAALLDSATLPVETTVTGTTQLYLPLLRRD